MNRDALYSRLPRPLQHAAVSAAGLEIRLRRYNRDFESILRDCRERESWSDDRLRLHAATRLHSFLLLAEGASPFYRDRFARHGFDPHADGFAEAAAERLSVLEKTDVRASAEAVRVGSGRSAVAQRTSGTTGQGLHFFTTRGALREQWAVLWRYLGWHGIERGTPCGWFFEKTLVPREQRTPPFWRYNVPGRQVMFSTQHMSEENLPSYVDELRRRQLTWLHGYPSAIALLAEHVARTGADLGYAVTHVTLASENVLDHQRAAIERAFGVRSRQHYAMTEAVANASECERGSLHLDEDFAWVELVPDPVSGAARIVGTNFTNPAFPLVRYATSDLAWTSTERCRCGRPGRVIHVDGREEDYIALPDGTRLGRLDHVFKDATTVREAQLVQREVGELTVRVVPGDGYSADSEAAWLADLRRRVGDDTAISVERCERIPRERSGKLRFVISEAGRLQGAPQGTL
jgi:phenylacetate-CoA ligase